MNPFKDPLLETRADGLVAVLKFETGATSKLTKKFIGELQVLVAASTKKQPLVYTTDRSVSVVYRAAVDIGHLIDERGARLDFSGRRFADGSGGYHDRIDINATCDSVELPDGGVWKDDCTPENTPRHTLPVLDPEAIAQSLVALVWRWIDAGNIVEVARAARVGWRPDVSYEDDIRDPADRDPALPPLTAEHAEKIRQMRRERGLRNAGE